MTSRIAKIFSVFLFVFAASVYALPQSAGAEAVIVEVTNRHSQSLNIVAVYLDAANNTWRTQGWWVVPPRSTFEIDFNAAGSHLYLHSYAGSTAWGGAGEGAISKIVIGEAFSYYDGQSCPAGNDRRAEKFTRYQIPSSGVVSYSPVVTI
jgi:uncharacterized membrane protein